MKNPQPLNLLLYENLISNDMIREIESDNNLKINIDFADNLLDLEEKLKDPKSKYDLISIYSFQAIVLDEEARLQPLNWSLVKNQTNISSDFMSLGGDEIAKKLLPLAWGVNGLAYDPESFSEPINSWQDVFSQAESSDKILLYDIPQSLYEFGLLKSQIGKKPAQKIADEEPNLEVILNKLLKVASLYSFGVKPKGIQPSDWAAIEVRVGQMDLDLSKFKFILPKEGGLFWTLNLAEPRFAPHPKEIAAFLNSVLKKKVALDILTNSHFSTTSKILDQEPIESSLKAQSIREIPLTQLKFQTSFQDASLFSQLVDQSLRSAR